MRVKPGVKLDGVHFTLWYAAAVWDMVRQENGYSEATITGGREGADAVGPARVNNTLHPAGYAVDLRTSDLPAAAVRPLAELLARYLGSMFEVHLESDHVHVELAHSAFTA